MTSNRWTWFGALLGLSVALSLIGCKAKTPSVAVSTVAQPRPVPAAPHATLLPPSVAGIALSPGGKTWMTGRLDQPFDFGSGAVAPSRGTEVYLAALDPTICKATATFVFGGAGGDKASTGLAVAANGNVGLIGRLSGEIDFTADQPDGPSPDGEPRAAGVDFLRSGPRTAFYAVLDGSSQGRQVTPIKAHMVDVGAGRLTVVASHPQQNAFVICGNTSRAVPPWSGDPGNQGVITGKKAVVAGGGMDIVVAKIDAATGAVLWGRQLGGDGDQVCGAASLDGNGDVVIAGSYTGKLAFDDNPLPEAPNVALLPYVAKLKAATGATLAAASWGKGGRSHVNSVAVDADDNVFVGGTLGASMDLGAGVTLAAEGMGDAFVVKLAPTLAPRWAKSFGDSSFEQSVKSLAVTATGDVLIAGTVTGSLGGLGLTSSGLAAPDAFVARLAAANGATLSAHRYGDPDGAQGITAIAVARTAAGALADLVIGVGTFTGTVTFGPTTLRASDLGSVAGYVARLPP
jgi:hypothetical protein